MGNGPSQESCRSKVVTTGESSRYIETRNKRWSGEAFLEKNRADEETILTRSIESPFGVTSISSMHT